jgi:hypothetical protein
MSPVVPIAKTVAKKVIPKSKKGKVAAVVAGAFGINIANGGDDKPKAATALTPSLDAQNSNPPVGTGTTNDTLLNLPKGTPIKAGTTGFPGIPYRLDYTGSTYTSASAVKGDAEKYFATKDAPQKAALLLRLGSIPNLYSSGQAPTSAYVSSMGNRVIWRPEDAKALESILLVQDQLGDATPDITLTNLISNPNLAAKVFGRVAGTAKATTPFAAIEAELNSKFLDLFESAPEPGVAKAYAKEINRLESTTGITPQQKEDILLKYVQKKANSVFTDMTPGATDKGALGRVVRNIRSAYDDNGIPINEKDVYNKAVASLRSPDAYKNIIDGVAMNASSVMPAFKDLFAQGKTAKEVLSPWINLKSQILGIPADQIKVSDMYDVGSGTTPIAIQDYKKQLYKSPEFKKTDAYKERSLGDMQTLLRAFNIG